MHSNAFEEDGYIGIPLLLVGVFLGARSWRSGRMQVAVVVFVVGAALSMGPHLFVDGHATGAPLPFLLFSRIPLVANLLPGRMSFEVDAALAAVVSFGLDDLRSGIHAVRPVRSGSAHGPLPGVSRRAARIAVAAACLALAAAIAQLPRWPYPHQAVVGLPPQVLRAVPSGDPVALTYPYPWQSAASPLAWQLVADFPFRLLGGYGEHPGSVNGYFVFPAPMHPETLQSFLAGQERLPGYGLMPRLSASLVSVTRSTLRRYSVRLVIVDESARNSRSVAILFSEALGPPSVSVDGFSVWAASGKWPLGAKSASRGSR